MPGDCDATTVEGRAMTTWYQHDPMSALEAKEAAQRLAFAPIAFQAALSLRDLGILAAVDASGAQGLTATEIAERTGVSAYGVGVLLDMGLSARIVTERSSATCPMSLTAAVKSMTVWRPGSW